ncbi:unnamed protein product [Tetraodon nigroviridis]|uniref:(spotted green pufferfish) hypothetical protein n=1 Tax=Tetraodon nigroviridis TaxID=99883 RepID=Q4S337_TETNG|nr:unnamed protein product [Tetraodon nigroviridis]
MLIPVLAFPPSSHSGRRYCQPSSGLPELRPRGRTAGVRCCRAKKQSPRRECWRSRSQTGRAETD